ncbi:MAG: hypothetical protein BGP14_03235 [Sphingobacteriales bacterium 44-15]|nr:MAG: hypothetical protein BGP14_03235 [Sphingobacteriales bacterium 44-15]
MAVKSLIDPGNSYDHCPYLLFKLIKDFSIPDRIYVNLKLLFFLLIPEAHFNFSQAGGDTRL